MKHALIIDGETSFVPVFFTLIRILDWSSNVEGVELFSKDFPFSNIAFFAALTMSSMFDFQDVRQFHRSFTWNSAF